MNLQGVPYSVAIRIRNDSLLFIYSLPELKRWLPEKKYPPEWPMQVLPAFPTERIAGPGGTRLGLLFF